jgi:cell wall assembly regulator SMI1
MQNAPRANPAWEAIESWLARDQPWVVPHLVAGAAHRQVKEAERTLGLSWPEDLAASYRRHDGESPEVWLFGAQSLLPIRYVVQTWRDQVQLQESGAYAGDDLEGVEIPREIQRVSWSPCWIPFAYDGGGGYLHVDLAPSAAGGRGQVIQTTSDGEYRLVAPSFTGFLGLYLRHLEAGGFDFHDGRIEPRCGCSAWWEHPPQQTS